MGDSVREMLSELVEKLQNTDGDFDSVHLLMIFACAMALLERRRGFVGGGGRFGGAGSSGKWDGDGPQWVSPEEAATEFGLDARRLCRNWRRLDYCRARDDGGRGFIVDRWALRQARKK
jgi:hypothetical protein